MLIQVAGWGLGFAMLKTLPSASLARTGIEINEMPVTCGIQEVANSKPTKFDATKPVPENWTANDVDRLISQCGVMEMSVEAPTPGPVDAESRKSDKDKSKMLQATQENLWAEKFGPINDWTLELFAEDPKRGVSLKWSDNFTIVPFKSLDTIEKVRRGRLGILWFHLNWHSSD